MCRPATSHDIERRVIEWQAVRVGFTKFDISNSAFILQPSAFIKHLRCNIRRDDFSNMRRERERSMAGACPHIEHKRSGLRLRQLNHSIQHRLIRMGGTGRIEGSALAEDRLGELRHDRLLMRIAYNVLRSTFYIFLFPV